MKKEVRNKKAAERNEKRRQKEIAALQKQYEKKLAKYQSLLKKEAAGEKLPYYEKYDAERDVKSIIRDLKDYGVENAGIQSRGGKVMKIIMVVALIVFLVFVLVFLFAAVKINGNGTNKFEEDIEQKKYIDDMQSKSRYILHPEYLTAARVYNMVAKSAVKQTDAK